MEEWPADLVLVPIDPRLEQMEAEGGPSVVTADRHVVATGALFQRLQARLAALFNSVGLGEITQGATMLYLLLATLLFGRWLVGYSTLKGLLRSGCPAPEAVQHLFLTMAGSLRRRPCLLVSERVRVPVSCGLWRPTVILPPSLCHPGAQRRLRWVFAHELTHLERRDAWACLLYGLGQVIYFYVPWFWWLRRQIRLCQEYIADAAAAGQADDAEDYAQFLLTLSKSPAVPLGATGVVEDSSDLYRRVTMLLTPVRVEKRCSRWQSLAAACSLSAVAVLVAGISLRANTPPANTVDKKEATAAPDDEANKNQTLSFWVGMHDGQKSDDEKEDPDKKGKKGRSSLTIELPDIDEMIKNLPKGLDEEQVKQFREQMEKARAQMQKALAEIKNQVKPQVERFQREELQVLKQQLQGLHKPQVFFYSSLQGRSQLGVRVAPPNEALVDQLDLHKGEGLVIEEVVPGSPADKAGLKAHDVLLEYNGKMVSNEPESLMKMVKETKADTAISVVVLRKGKKETIKGITLPEAKASEEGLPGRNKVVVRPQLTWKAAPHDALEQGKHHVFITSNRNNNQFTTRQQEDGLTITITGSVSDDKAKVEEIKIEDGKQTDKYRSLEKVPEQYRDKVKSLVEMTGKNKFEVEIKKRKQKESSKELKPTRRIELFDKLLESDEPSLKP
jgi:beta-lactamase regulating signal transducer with metallopeptidase domain